MKNLTATICLAFALLLASTGVGYALPSCPSDQDQYYDNCFGTHTFSSGNKYVGEYKDDKSHGQGTFTFANGDKYVGEFRGGDFNGQGTFTFASGDKYVGEWKDDKRNGQGTFTFASGDKYVGQFRGGDFNGQGTYTFAVSDKYVGQFKDDKFNGQGTRTYASGEIEEGLWKDDEFQYAQKVTPPAVARESPTQTLRRKTGPGKIVSASSGSGFAVSSNGHIITNHHVIEGCQNVKIHHNGKSVSAIVVTYDPQNDLALLKGNFRPSTVLPLSTNSPELLQDVYVAGYPFGRNVSTGVKVTKGIISSLTGIGNNFSNIQIDAALQPGNSGGPILDDKGNVVGVAVARLDKMKTLEEFGSIPENTNFGIKTSVVRSILESSNVSSRKPNRRSISKTNLGKMISDGTFYLSCWMTTAQIEKMRTKKAIFQKLD